MPAPFQVDVVSPEAVIWSGEAELVIARTTEGDIGVMADHEPTMATLATGSAEIQTGSEKVIVAVHGGFLQVYMNQVTLLSDRAEIVEGSTEEAREKAAELRVVEEESQDDEVTPAAE